MIFCLLFFFFKQKSAYEMLISDWSSDVCSSDLGICLSFFSDLYINFPLIKSKKIKNFYFIFINKMFGFLSNFSFFLKNINFFREFSNYEIGRASCRERVCKYV